MSDEDKLQRIDEALTRWHRRLSRAANAIKKLDGKRRRLVAKSQCHCAAEPVPHAPHRAQPRYEPKPAVVIEAKPEPVVTKTMADALGSFIPPFLQRTKLEPAAQALSDEIDAKKKLKTRGRIAKLKAQQSGETRKMPLQGKAALEAIRNG